MKSFILQELREEALSYIFELQNLITLIDASNIVGARDAIAAGFHFAADSLETTNSNFNDVLQKAHLAHFEF